MLNAEDFQYGLIVDRIRAIICVADDEIMPVPRIGQGCVDGIFQGADQKNIMLIQVETLIADRYRELRSVAKLRSRDTDQDSHKARTRCLQITNDCYLILSIGRNFAIALSDVQEIIEPMDLMDLPAASGFNRQVLNLRGTVIPVIDLRQFYGYADDDAHGSKKVIVAQSRSRYIALEVDHILTIHKQVRYLQTPSLNPQLNGKKDTLDRFIEKRHYLGQRSVCRCLWS